MTKKQEFLLHFVRNRGDTLAKTYVQQNKTKEKTLASTRPGRIRYTRSQTHEQLRTLTKPVLIASCKRSQKHGHTALRREGTDPTHKLQLYFVYCPSHP